MDERETGGTGTGRPTARRLASCSVAAAATVSVLAGCAGTDQRGEVSAAASQMLEAARRGDGARACAGLVPRAVEGLETGDQRCAEQITKLGLVGGPAGPVEIWGDTARVRVGDDTVFAVRWGPGWKVTAAGCRERTDRPYECQVQT
ncbi:hypothetical protein ACFVH6_06130 [Spirillospora sp. NPDC127200]